MVPVTCATEKRYFYFVQRGVLDDHIYCVPLKFFATVFIGGLIKLNHVRPMSVAVMNSRADFNATLLYDVALYFFVRSVSPVLQLQQFASASFWQ